MEPISAISSIVGVVDVAFRLTSSLLDYVKDVRNASTDRGLLAEETSSLAKLLERLLNRAQNPGFDQEWLDIKQDLLRQFVRGYGDLAILLGFDVATGQLKQESRLKKIRNATKWSFSKNEVYSILERVTRLQHYASTLLLDEQKWVIQQALFKSLCHTTNN